MAPFILKFKGNKSFVAFHNMSDGESLTKTWKVCTKVAAHLEQGQRLENLSWRLWHLHNIMVESDNAKSKREFKKLSRTMGDKLDREKGKNIEELRAPGYKRTQSSDKMRRRAEEIERLRDESHSSGGMRRMQFTFSFDSPTPTSGNSQKTKSTSSLPGKKVPTFKEPPPKVDPARGVGTGANIKKDDSDRTAVPEKEKAPGQNLVKALVTPPTSQTSPPTPELPSPTVSKASTSQPTEQQQQRQHEQQPAVRLPGLFSSNFGPTALLYPSPSFTQSLTYGEDVTISYDANAVSPKGGMGISRPTIELPLDELLEVDVEISDAWGEVLAGIDAAQASDTQKANDHSVRSTTDNHQDEDKPFDIEYELAQMAQAESTALTSTLTQPQTSQSSYPSTTPFFSQRPSSTPRQRPAPATTLNPMALHHSAPSVTVNNGGANGGSRTTPGATAAPSSTLPAGTKTECSNCGATHTPLWRRGLNDELNCNACGLYCKLHKRPRPKSMRTSHGENPRNSHAHTRHVDSEAVGAKCFNCHTTATPLWRKDDEGKTVCNACGLYYKLHGTSRPLSMKSDVIRKRSRHEIRRAGFAGSGSETPSASPGASRRASPARALTPPLPVEEEHRPEEPKTPQFCYDYTTKPSRTEYAEKTPTANDILGSVFARDQGDNNGRYDASFPGPYHPDYLYQYVPSSGLQPIQTTISGNSSEYTVEDRGNKRRRLSSASYDSSSTPTSPPPSATSLHSSNYKSPTSSPCFPSYELPYAAYTFQSFSDSNPSWMSASSTKVHPPMSLPEDAPMEYLHPPMAVSEVSSSQPSASSMSSYLHPPMLPVEEAAMSYMHPPLLPQANSPIVGYSHPPMLPNYWIANESHVSYCDSNTSNNMEMFDSMMNPLD